MSIRHTIQRLLERDDEETLKSLWRLANHPSSKGSNEGELAEFRAWKLAKKMGKNYDQFHSQMLRSHKFDEPAQPKAAPPARDAPKLGRMYSIHLDRSAMAPGSSYTDWGKPEHMDKIKQHLKNAGLSHLEPNLTAYGYEDLSIDMDDRDQAIDAAKKLDRVIPTASKDYRESYMPNGGHHAYVVEYDKDEPGGHSYADHYPIFRRYSA